MRPYTELITRMHSGELPIPKFITKRGHGVKLANIEAAFDIETSSVTVGDEKNAHMYVWMFGMGFGEPVYYGRTFEEFQDLCKNLSIYLGLSDKKLLVIYCHNLSYEFQFIKDYFDWTANQLHLDSRDPLSVTTTQGIQFRCSFRLSGMSLANTARNLTKHEVSKAEGDLNYKLIRNPSTPLTREEWNYCIDDIRVVLAYINEEIEKEGDITKITYTKTGRVRKYMRGLCYYNNVDGSKKKGGRCKSYPILMRTLTMKPNVYEMAKQAFMGGFTHANSMHVDRELNNVTSVDFSSAYPSVMVSEKFPMSTFKCVKITSRKQFESYLETHAVLFDIQFINIRPKITQENYLSKSKCHENSLVNPIINNGRVDSADALSATLTEVDFAIMQDAYDWDDYGVNNVFVARKDYLPKPIIEGILKLYQDKTELKGVKGRESDYNLSKEMLNSVYGMCVSDPVKTNHRYTDKWEEEKKDVLDALIEHNGLKERFLYYPWGVWTTAYTRRNLWDGIIELKDDYIYSDTDSIKMFNYEKHKPYFDKFNEDIIKKIETMCEDPRYELDPNLIKPKTIEGVVKPLGVWDYEDTYKRFKTLGAKRYAQQEWDDRQKKDKFTITIAGLNKEAGAEYLMEISNHDFTTVFKNFKHGMFIPEDRTNKSTHTYIDIPLDEPRIYQSTDYLGDAKEIHAKSSIHLKDVSFELTLSDEYQTYLAKEKALESFIYTIPKGTVRK